MPGWLRAKLLQQPENTTVENLCFFLRENNCEFIIFAKQTILSLTHLAKRHLRLQIHLLPL